MAMDPSFAGLPDFDDFLVDDHDFVPISNQHPDLINEVDFSVPSSLDLNFLENPFLPPDLGTASLSPPVPVDAAVEPNAPSPASGSSSLSSVGTSPGGNSSSDDSEYSETVIKYMTQILMEENIEDKPLMFYDPLGLQVTEKSFYEALGEKYPPSNQYQQAPEYPPSSNQYKQAPYLHRNVDSPDDVFSESTGDYGTNSSSTTTSTEPQWLGDLGEYWSPFSQGTDHHGDFVFQTNGGSQLVAHPSKAVYNNVGDGLELLGQNLFTDSESMLQFRRGVEEASKFLPQGNQLVFDVESSMVLPEWKGEQLKLDKSERESSPAGSKGRKNHEREDIDLEEGRSNKQSAVYTEDSDLSEMFDKVLLSTDSLSLCCNDGTLQNEGGKVSQTNEQPQGANGGKTRAKKQDKKKDTVDLRTLLILCAQAVSACDNRTANELLKQIRQHSSPLGDGSQRLAHFFANALEARLAGTGTGTQIFYSALLSKRVSTFEILKAYKVHLSACPFKRISLFFANKMICKAAEKATSVHIIDFGIEYGFQWPILIHKFSRRAGGPPKLRITGIEFPQPGFRPTETILETGKRLAEYCERFNVPFEYHAIASQKWETIQIEDLKIDRNEMLAVNCFYRFKNLHDETVEDTSPRNAVLNLIRRMNPDIFVHTIVNGAYNGPFFVTRFREALFHFSALFDVFDATLSCESQQRLMLENEFLGREAMNVIACEGLERVERPETYKQWQVRTTRAGFRPLPLDQELMSIFRCKMKEWYHKDFVLDEDNRWMLQGWKGRIVYASSCWVPA
ncbi:Scarecrow-like protein 14 [Morella rubra]|uniref:Scarecrow-like protein 14 n=1 Tax=Morella rubra TaxID=262757 RepID=A0A6A1V3G7_9ROSI|nr:Scarecrow-like protein 14 [Morella rubra]